MEFFEKCLDSQRIFEGKIFKVRKDKVLISDGSIHPREIVEHNGGVAVVPVTDNGDVLMVRQFRYAVGKELLEIPAGKLEEGEEPSECARRELSEETGCTASKWVYMGEMYPTPGYCQETLHIFLATGLKQGEMHLDEGELLAVERVPMKTLCEMIFANKLPDAKTVFGVLKAREHMKLTF